MSRSPVAASRHGLIAVVAVAIATGSIALATQTASADGCTWQRHSKPVFKQLRRHGQLRRVKRVKHWWTCRPLPAAPTPGPALPALPTSDALPGEETKPSPAHLSVKAAEWSYTLSHSDVAAGEAIVELNNQGYDSHNLVLQREGSADPPLTVPEAGSKEQMTARFTLAPGTYRLYCSLFEHETKGMHATLLVAGAAQ